MAGSVLASGQFAFCLRLLRHLGQIPPSGVDEPVADLLLASVPILKAPVHRDLS